MSGKNPSEREETEQGRLDRELDQLLNELRVSGERWGSAATMADRIIRRGRSTLT